MSWFRTSDHQHGGPASADRGHASSVPDLAAFGDGADGFPRAPFPVDAARERRLLIDLVIYAFDRARTPAVQQRLTTGLAQIGVQVIRPDGGPFDPASQEAGGVVPTDDPALHNLIAETESAGFRDGERIVREPVVVVYRLTAGG